MGNDIRNSTDYGKDSPYGFVDKAIDKFGEYFLDAASEFQRGIYGAFSALIYGPKIDSKKSIEDKFPDVPLEIENKKE